MHTSPDGISLLHTAANIASPNGANSPPKLTIDAINDIAYKIILDIENNSLRLIFFLFSISSFCSSIYSS